ncbi:hypothetical protein SEA_HFRANCETTE_53 [Streptomyces phage HFrancette]|uniref:Uncharacterized protein n=7 Tax=Ignaciovirus TaxID=3152509 RepID=A0A6M9Z4G6_9CAUD|nr:hypothetical protein QEN60_gp52 [Streptomyces phage Ignacio]YP_010756230.1 hypothetical protein QEN61_gp52 [Streptomyces phage Eklok]YP_010756288.1 hypothetical protein QEN62_gp52 [Streptomyces phage AxeJC]YP_010756345.1 hypothetical protein QEN63_gp51 [Streptomyces phage Vondra]YP_010756404.1 hypothetical protein QEN64_gp53 [Streptomyces phage HFrancette]YP_010756463.1 hypothetical protein QEN65_gp53 [Streptomyces phage Cumberbatch]YP_010756521.1 hypothetical protein QEN66_gp52 [Streptomy
MSDRSDRGRIRLDDLTDNQLDQLYDERDQLRADCQKWADCAASAEKVRRAHAADADRYEAHLRGRAEQAEAALDRVRALADEMTGWKVVYCPGELCADSIRAAIDGDQPAT